MPSSRHENPASRETFPGVHPVHHSEEGTGRCLVVAVAASVGGIPALRVLLAALPASLPAAVLVVQHVQAGRRSRLAEVLALSSALPVAQAEGGEALAPGRVWVAPPGRHLVLGGNGRLALSDAPRAHFVRPSADLLFTSVAAHAGAGAVAVVLTGRYGDGSGGVEAVRDAGGTVVVQDPEGAAEPGMPLHAIATGAARHVVPLERIAPLIVEILTA